MCLGNRVALKKHTPNRIREKDMYNRRLPFLSDRAPIRYNPISDMRNGSEFNQPTLVKLIFRIFFNSVGSHITHPVVLVQKQKKIAVINQRYLSASNCL